MKPSFRATPPLWSSLAKDQSYPALSGDAEADVAIVGGGITGISAACFLAKAGKKVIVLEAHQIGKGTSGSSTGNLYAPTGSHLSTTRSKLGVDALRGVVSSRLAAVDSIERLIREYDIDCDFQRVPFYLFTTPEDTERSSLIRDEFEAAQIAGLPSNQQQPADFPFTTDEILTVPDQAQFNPLKYVQQLAAAISGDNCQIYEHTQVTNVEDGEPCIIHTKAGTVRAKQVIMATHTPKGIYAVHTAMKPQREFALAVSLNGNLPADGTYWHVMGKLMHSIRPVREEGREYLLVLGGQHITGENTRNHKHVKEVEDYLRSHFDVKSLDYVWAAQNYKSPDTLPYIGTSPAQEHVYIATGFAADGLVYGTLAALLIHDLILGKENELADLYSPTRFTPKASAGKFLKEGFNVVKHFVKDYLFYSKTEGLEDIPAGEGRTIKIDNEHLAAYRDEEGELHLVSGICPHMGCVVHWNSTETSWDCPCHGSRFSTDGELIEGPAYEGLSKPESE